MNCRPFCFVSGSLIPVVRFEALAFRRGIHSPSSNERTFAASAVGVNGFWRNEAGEPTAVVVRAETSE